MTEPAAASTTTRKPAYTPRSQFIPFHNRYQRWAVLVVHRRGGKTTADINELIERGLYTKKPDAQYGYCAPQLKQAKKVAWAFLKKYSKHVQKRVNEAELYVELVNGSKIYIFGADDPDSARGIYLDGIVLDEVAQIKPSFWSEVVRPALADRKGWAVFIGTPKGKGNLLYTLQQKAIAKPDKWFYLCLKASETGLIGAQELAELKEDMDDAEYEQEFECSFEAALVGSIYGKQVKRLTDGQAIKPTLPFFPQVPVSLSIDIGKRDACAIWFWQLVNGRVRWIEYWEQVGWDAAEVLDMLQRKPYTYENMWLPHDAFHSTFASKKSPFDTFLDGGAPVRRVPDPDNGFGVWQGIDATRKVLRTYDMEFDNDRCKVGIEALKNYSRDWDAKQAQFSNSPKHDRYSHGADAMRYACLSISMVDIQRSIDKVINEAEQERASKDGTLVKIGKIVVNTGYTLNMALEEHDKRIRLRQQEGRGRI